MPTYSLSVRAFVLALLATLAMASPGRAESFGLPPVPSIDPGTPPKMPEQDRKGGQGGAAAMAAAAAAMQGVSCAMMMREAMKMPPGSDKSMTMAMAMQQCAQAAQTAANAAKNKDGEKKLADAGKMPSMQVQPFQAPSPTKDDQLSKAGEIKESEEPEAPEVPEVSQPEIPEFKAPEAAPSAAPVELAGAVTPETSIPNRIERAKLGYDESGKQGTAPTPERALGVGSSIATAMAKSGDNTLKGSTDGKNEFVPNNFSIPGRKGRAEAPTADGGGAGNADGGTAASGDAANPLDSMLALLGGGSAEAGAGPSSFGEVLALEPSGEASSKRGPNIFEYATFRYKKATFDDNRIKARSKKRALPASARTASAY